MNRRNFLKLLAAAPALSICWHQRNGLSIAEVEKLAEELGGKWIDVYLMRIV